MLINSDGSKHGIVSIDEAILEAKKSIHGSSSSIRQKL